MLVHCQQNRHFLIQSENPRVNKLLTLNKLQNLSQFQIFISLFSCQWLIALFTRVLLRVTVYYYYVTYASEAAVKSCSIKKAFLEISQNSQENAYARVSFLKKRLWHRCFPVNFSKFLRTPFLRNTSGQLFLKVVLLK